MDPSTSVATLGLLTSALRSATATRRFFRSYVRWSTAFDKYTIAAVAMKQLSCSSAYAYRDELAKLMEKSKYLQHGHFLIILYDDLFRRQLAERATMSEPDLKVQKCFMKIDKEIL